MEFKKNASGSIDEIFNELCFCILTANFNAKRSIEIQKKIGGGFCSLCEIDLAKKLKELGHRFPNMRAKFIVEARALKKDLANLLKKEKDERVIRDWITKNIKGLGYKESSHFLRNIGKDNCAIIDFHIIDILAENKLIKSCKTLSKKKYLEIEEILSNLARKLKLTLAELDLYLWYLETGSVLK